MRALKDFIARRGTIAEPEVVSVDDKTIFHLFRAVVREQYGVIGEQEMEPIAYTNGELSVRTKNPLWASELWMKKDPFLSSLNERIGGQIVRELKMIRSTGNY